MSEQMCNPIGNMFVVPKPWICPRCNRMNAPHIGHCTCQPDAAARVGFGWVVYPGTTGNPKPTGADGYEDYSGDEIDRSGWHDS